jgi:transcriptional regulator with XRE-family HTH domain/mannose-6-phosphate isomerase-like protein (cupin superfamily)
MATKTDKGESTSEARRVNRGREQLAGPVGEGLRKYREEAGMSLRALARAVGVSPSLISQIEHGKATPSVGTLYAIVSELGISLDELFFDNPRGAAAVAEAEHPRHMDPGDDRTPPSHWQAPSEGPVLRAGNRLSLTLATGVRWERLTASPDPEVEFLYCTYPVGGESAPAEDLMTHSGSEYGIILEGRCGATVAEDYYELEAGDSIAFDSRTPHRIWNLSNDRPMVAIWTVVGRDSDPRVS